MDPIQVGAEFINHQTAATQRQYLTQTFYIYKTSVLPHYTLVTDSIGEHTDTPQATAEQGN